jgi:DNA-binding transcriptional ArsR family regulator
MPESPLPSERPDDDTRRLDPRSLRGLAHPLRIRLLRALRRYGPATASQLAERLGESSGATSYHLRQLAAHDFVVDDPELGKGRERWWKAAHQGTSMDESLYYDPDPEVRGALDTLIHELASMHGQELGTWLGTMHEWPEAWVTKADLSDFTVRLTPDLLGELDQKIHDLINSYQGRALPDDAGDAAEVRFQLHVFPQKNA